MSYPDFPLTLALQNFMPVVLSALGLWWIAADVRARNTAAGDAARLGVALIVTAGVMKALWKLVMALSRVDVPILSQALFPMIAPGFTLVAWSVLAADQSNWRARAAWLPPLLVSIAALGAAVMLSLIQPGRTWVFVLIGLSTMSNMALAVLLIRASLRRSKRLAAVLFGVNLTITFALSAIASSPNRSLEVHWTEQIISTISNAGFAWAAWMLTHTQDARVQDAPAGRLTRA